MVENSNNQIPNSLRTWFVVHFVTDIIFAIPLLLFPEFLLSFFGWQTVDPITASGVGAALMGIGVESLLMRNATAEVFRAMLNLKIIWSSSVIFGIILGILKGGPPTAWLFLAIFFVFMLVWIRYRLLLR